MFALTTLLLAVTSGVLPEEAPTTAEVRAAVQHSIPYIQEKGVWWIEQKKCVSCHRVSNMVWSLSAAEQHGFEVSDELSEWRRWAIESSLAADDNGKVVGLGNKEGVAQILVGLEGREGDTEQISHRAELLALLRDGQQPDGGWKAGGQLPGQKRPASETAYVSTLWLTLALADDRFSEDSDAAVRKAMKYIQEVSAGKSTEWYALRLLLAAKSDLAERDGLMKELLAQQQADGGWGWMVGEESDALGTGMAIYSLVAAGQDVDSTPVQRAKRFLVTTQRDDGSWAVKGTKANKKDRVEETSVYWGTTWAALGLMAGIPVQE